MQGARLFPFLIASLLGASTGKRPKARLGARTFTGSRIFRFLAAGDWKAAWFSGLRVAFGHFSRPNKRFRHTLSDFDKRKKEKIEFAGRPEFPTLTDGGRFSASA